MADDQAWCPGAAGPPDGTWRRDEAGDGQVVGAHPAGGLVKGALGVRPGRPWLAAPGGLALQEGQDLAALLIEPEGAVRRAVSPDRTAPLAFPPSSCSSATGRFRCIFARRLDRRGRAVRSRRFLPDGCVQKHVPAVAADLLVAAQQALALESGSLGGLD